MSQQGHSLCESHTARYRPSNIRPTWFVGPEHLSTTLYCGRCAAAGKKQRGGIVFGAATMDTGLIQFTNQAAYWLSPSERQHAISLTQ